MKTRLIVVSAGDGTEQTFGELYDEIVIVNHSDTVPDDFCEINEHTTVIFEGGTDISSAYYSQKPSAFSQQPDIRRDQHEFAMYHRALRRRASVIGICRGAQLCCVANFGKLIQHVTGHRNSNHEIEVLEPYTGEVECFPAASDHHQMMFPFNLPEHEFQLWGWPAQEPLSKRYFGEGNSDITLPRGFIEPEIVWFPRTRTIAIQPHPEWMDQDTAFPKWCRKFVSAFLLK